MIEETTVREKVSDAKSCIFSQLFLKATESIKKVFAMIRIKDFETTIMAMMKRLMASDFYSSK